MTSATAKPVQAPAAEPEPPAVTPAPAAPSEVPPTPAPSLGPDPTTITIASPASAGPMVVPITGKRQERRTQGKPKKPPHRGITDFQRSAFRLFGNHFARRPTDAKLDDALRKSRLGMRAEAVQSAALLSGIIGATMGGVSAAMFLLVLVPLMGIALPLPMLLVVALSPAFAGLGGYVAVVASPASRAKARARNIDERLPYALNYIAAMASAGVTVDQIFRSLADQPIYGEVAREAEAIYRDMTLFGKDAVTAFKRAIQRTPSQRFAEMLQGAVTTFASGGDLQIYFSAKAERYMVENRQVQKQFLDTMGLMAETYVTTAVAGPLFLMVMMAIMGMLSGTGPGQLYLVVYLMLPTANFGFVYGLFAMSPKV